MSKQYDRIWLQVDPDGDRPDHDATFHDEVTWCQDQINDNDWEYLRATPERKAAPDLLKALVDVQEILGITPTFAPLGPAIAVAPIMRAAIAKATGDE